MNNKVCDTQYILILLSITILVCITSWNIQKQKNKKANPSNECLIGQIKKKEGLYYSGCFDIWHVYHFMLYIIVGLLLPYQYPIIIIITILWEYIEHISFKKLKMCNQFFCGRIEDIFLNLLGYYVGSKLSLCK